MDLSSIDNGSLPAAVGKTLVAVLIASTLLVFLLQHYLTPRNDPREPPVAKPSIPLIGHLLGIVRHQSNYHKILTAKHPSKPCLTLPILNGKLYAIYDPYLIQQVLRAKTASFEAFETEYVQKTFGLSNEEFAQVEGNKSLISDFTDAIHVSFQTESLYKMNMTFLGFLARKMEPISGAKQILDTTNKGKEKIDSNGCLEVENFFLWCRDVVTAATTQALYGPPDPFAGRPDLLDAIWVFEEHIPYFLLFSSAASFMIPRAFQARKLLQVAMRKYFGAEHDLKEPKTATLVSNRSKVLRHNGFKAETIAKMEMILPPVATLNTVPTSYFLLTYVLSKPDLVQRLRKEMEAFAQREGDVVTLNVSKFDQGLPLLVSCYRETMRFVNHSVGNRRMESDLTITTQEGQSYLLKKGVDVQLPAGVVHADQNAWGTDAAVFKPDRFITSAQSKADERLRKVAFIPFGGGRHLCPGRNFAFTEVIGFATMLLLSFDTEAVGKGFDEMKMGNPQLASGTTKPVGHGAGLGAKIRPRPGWENIKWDFIAE